MYRLFYTLLYHTVASVILPFDFLKRDKELKKVWLLNKLGIFTSKTSLQKKVVWVHSVSVGEVMAVSSLIKTLSKDFSVLVSTITDTGYRVAKEKFKGLDVEVIFLPLDCPFAIKRLIKHFSPSILLITETELWPNLICETAKVCPVVLVNGRLGERSFKRYKKIKFFVKKILNAFRIIGVQNETYKERFLELGANPEKVKVLGNTKFDIEIEDKDFPWEKCLKHPVVLAGSTHSPEEKLILETFLDLPEVSTLLIAPRHPQRFKEVEDLIKGLVPSDVKFFKLTKIENKSEFPGERRVILIDKIGVLASLYRVCDIAIIGGSFIPHGGQNPLEAIYWKKPVIFGPYMFNFPFIKEFVDKGLCIQVKDTELKKVLKELSENESKRRSLGEGAYEVFTKYRGATERTLKLVYELLKG